MTIKEMPKICGTDKLRLYDDNKIVVETWIIGASLSSFVEEHPVLKQYSNRKINYIEMCIEGCLNEIVVMEIFLK